MPLCQILLSSPVVAALVVGGFGLLTFWIGFSRFKTEKWWERKAATYLSALESLHVLEASAEIKVEYAERGLEIPAERQDKIRLEEVAARRELKRLANMGAILITKRAASILRELEKSLLSLDTKMPDHEYYEARGLLVFDTIIAIKVESKKDLKT